MHEGYQYILEQQFLKIIYHKWVEFVFKTGQKDMPINLQMQLHVSAQGVRFLWKFEAVKDQVKHTISPVLIG